MDKTRKKSIDELVEKLGQKYDFNSIDSLKKMAEDNEINVIESSKVIVSFCNWNSVYINRQLSLDNKKETYGHELGHILLGHFKENFPVGVEEMEANYFSSKLGYEKNNFETFIECLIKFLIKPITTPRYVFSKKYRREYQSKLMSDFNKRNKNKS